MKLLIGALFYLRQFALKMGGKIFDSIRDPATGKISFLKNPKDNKPLFVAIFIVFFVGIGAYKLMTSDVNLIKGVEDFEQEVGGKLPIKAKEIEKNKELGGDPLANILNKKENMGDGSSRGDIGDGKPTASECMKLLEKLKSNQKLSLQDRTNIKYCLESNILGLQKEETALANLLLGDQVLSDEEKKLIKELFANEPACQDEINKQMGESGGNEFLSKLIEDPSFNAPVLELLSNPELMKQISMNDNLLKNRLNFTDSEIKYFKELLSKCSTDLLKKMLSDPKMKEIMQKILAAAAADPNFLKNALSEAGMTPEEADLIRRLLSGELDPSDPMYAVAKALIGSDPIAKQQAKDLLKAQALGDAALASALSKKLNNEELTPEELALLNSLNSKDLAKAYDAKKAGNDALASAFLKQAKGEKLSPDELRLIAEASDFGVGSLSDADKLKKLTQDLANRQAEIDAMKEELARAQAAAREGAERFAQGLPLTKEQQLALRRATDLQGQIDDLESKQGKQKERLVQGVADIQNTINQIGATMRESFPSGVEVGFNLPKCQTQPFKIVRRKSTGGGKKAGLYTADGREVTPEQIRLLKAYRKAQEDNKLADQKDKDGFLNPLNDTLLGNGTTLVAATRQEGAGSQGISSLFIKDDANLKPFQLTPDMIIPAQLVTEILVTDKQAPTVVRIKILKDVYEPKSGNLVIPKNAIVFGRTGTFDIDTATMQLTMDQVSLGGKIIDVSLAVGSADLSAGLKGEVRDTRGKLLLATMVTAFTSGALGAISQNFISPLQDSTLLADSLQGAALQGGSRVAQRIAEMYAGDLQQAPKLFYAPASIPVVLVPTGN